MASRISVFLTELKRRKVFRVAVAYAGLGFAFASGAEYIFEILGLPLSAARVVAVLVAVGFPVALVLAWVLEITPEGVRVSEPAPDSESRQPAPALGTLVRMAIGTVVLTGAFVAAYFLVRIGLATDAEPPSVVVLPPVNQTGDPGLDPLGDRVASSLTTQIEWARDQFLGTVTLETPPLVDPSGREDPQTWRQTLQRRWAEETNATIGLLGEYVVQGGDLEFRLRWVDSGGEVLDQVDPVQVPRSDPEAGLKTLDGLVVVSLAWLVEPNNELAIWALPGESPHPEAIRAVVEGLMELDTPGGRDRYVASLREAAEIDATYLSPLLLLAREHRNSGQWGAADSLCTVMRVRFHDASTPQRLDYEWECAMLRGDYRAALERARAFVEYYPNNVSAVAINALQTNHPEEAERASSQFDGEANAYSRRNAWGVRLRHSLALHLLEKHRRELQVIRRGREESPDFERLRRAEIAALIALGRVEEAMDTMEAALDGLRPDQTPSRFLDEAALECEVHGCPEMSPGLWERSLAWHETRPAEVLQTLGNKRVRSDRLLKLKRNEEALDLAREVAAAVPDSLDDLGTLGVALALVGNQEEALEVVRRLGDWEDPWVLGRNTFWRACIAANLGELEEAVGLLWQAEAEGAAFSSFDPHRNTLFRPLRGSAAFEKYVEPRGN